MIRTAAVAAIGFGVVALADSVVLGGEMPARMAQAADTDHSHQHQSATDSHHQHGGAADEPVDVALETAPERVLAGTQAELVFALKSPSGQDVDGLLTHHGRKLHVVIISDDMQMLGHIHPEDFDTEFDRGVAKVFFTFPEPGRYLVAVDFMTEAQGSGNEHFIVEVGGAPAESMPETEAGPGTVSVNIGADDRYTEPVFLQKANQSRGYDVSVQRPDGIRADEEASFAFRFSKDGTPITDLRLYLDAPLHLAVVKDDLTPFLHTHGTLSQEAHAGHGGHGSAHENTDSGADTIGPEIAATISFPEPGTYYLFAQAVHGDQLLTSRFPVQVR